MSNISGERVLTVENLQTHFPTRSGLLRAVDGVSFSVDRGRILGLVGESGCGKSATGFSIFGMVDPPGRIVGGKVCLNGVDLTRSSEEELRNLRGNRIAIILQDPMTTLNPVLRIETQMAEAILAHRKDVPWQEARALSRDALGAVGISAPEERLDAYPHQLSGGMRQRVAIAIAMINRPDLIIADEPTTALDVTIQAQILFEMQKLCRETGTALLWITHDLSVVAGLAHDIAVMYAGKILETGTVEAVLGNPLHPYTRGLLNSVPSRNKRGTPLAQIPGTAPVASRLPTGCSFRPRCSRALGDCIVQPPLTIFHGGQMARCFNPHIDDQP